MPSLHFVSLPVALTGSIASTEEHNPIVDILMRPESIPGCVGTNVDDCGVMKASVGDMLISIQTAPTAPTSEHFGANTNHNDISFSSC
ncbi:hypothetical protein LZ30DRAFT_447851 [Colletotrichum cereale]|nr:hypothetical protein LZ30DRAFT_447851 [Colletotrichum cereale]